MGMQGKGSGHRHGEIGSERKRRFKKGGGNAQAVENAKKHSSALCSSVLKWDIVQLNQPAKSYLHRTKSSGVIL